MNDWGVHVRKILLVSILSFASYIQAAPIEKWTKVSSDEYGETFVDHHYLKRLTDDKNIVEYGYKYVYQYGVPSIGIPPQGYIQAIHQINCAEKTRAIIKSQRFSAKGKAIDELASYDSLNFEPIYDSQTSLMKIYKFVCKTS